MKIKIALVMLFAILIVIIITISLFVLRFSATADSRVNGFAGAWGALRLSMPRNDYAIISRDPLEIMIYRDDFYEIIVSFFDDDDFIWEGGSFAGPTGYRDGVIYHARRRVYTASRYIVRFEAGGRY